MAVAGTGMPPVAVVAVRAGQCLAWPFLRTAGVALAAAWPYYGGYGYFYDSCVQWVPDYSWVNVCGYQYGGYYY
jgi:hypothetical protein